MKYLFSLIIVAVFSISQVQAQDYVSFKLNNPSPQSIPLKIPNVMNPNLSPFSTSGVMELWSYGVMELWSYDSRLREKSIIHNLKSLIIYLLTKL